MEVKGDVKLRTRKLAVFVTCLGLAAAFPVLSSADKGGVPHNNKPCPAKGKRHHKKPKPNNKGKKCGFAPGSTTTTTSSTPSTTTTTTTETTTTTSTT
jgi:Predicted solute binding protein